MLLLLVVVVAGRTRRTNRASIHKVDSRKVFCPMVVCGWDVRVPALVGAYRGSRWERIPLLFVLHQSLP